MNRKFEMNEMNSTDIFDSNETVARLETEVQHLRLEVKRLQERLKDKQEYIDAMLGG